MYVTVYFALKLHATYIFILFHVLLIKEMIYDRHLRRLRVTEYCWKHLESRLVKQNRIDRFYPKE